jgi:hypothetical protein
MEDSLPAQQAPPMSPDPGKPVLHVLVIGFHHKKGCIVEYAYPPLIPGLKKTHTFTSYNAC